MPQMMPMNWLILLLLFLITFIMLFITMNSMKMNNISILNSKSISLKNKMFKW